MKYVPLRPPIEISLTWRALSRYVGYYYGRLGGVLFEFHINIDRMSLDISIAYSEMELRPLPVSKDIFREPLVIRDFLFLGLIVAHGNIVKCSRTES